MWELDERDVLRYLRLKGHLAAEEPAGAEALAWGVSNLVLRVQTPHRAFVLKQARAQLRTKDPWFSRLNRVFREREVMQVLAPLLPPGTIPAILFEDRENYLFAMAAAPADHVVWKARLLAGICDDDCAIARRTGELLGTIHAATVGNEELASRFGDHEVFWQLRVDPFYLRVAERFPEVAPAIGHFVDEMLATKVALVHADFSPKNILVHASGLTLVDFETAHWGDPAFDLGFYLSHLALKAFKHAPGHEPFLELTRLFWKSYLDRLGPVAQTGPLARDRLVPRAILHFAGCAWARIDGTSKIDYLPDEPKREAVRRLCRGLLLEPAYDWQQTLARAAAALRGRTPSPES